MKLLVVNGPNMNTLGQREPEIYGTDTLEDIETLGRKHAEDLNATADFFQSNSEGEIIDHIQKHQAEVGGIIINPGGLAFSSVALRDCLAATGVPVIEVHISNTYAREEFRHRSLIAPIAKGQITGLGMRGYMLAISYFVREYAAKARAAAK